MTTETAAPEATAETAAKAPVASETLAELEAFAKARATVEISPKAFAHAEFLPGTEAAAEASTETPSAELGLLDQGAAKGLQRAEIGGESAASMGAAEARGQTDGGHAMDARCRGLSQGDTDATA
ncbi:MAG: hypothetical protein ACFB6S_11580 [Geminicoccaceae bacterium]